MCLPPKTSQKLTFLRRGFWGTARYIPANTTCNLCGVRYAMIGPSLRRFASWWLTKWRSLSRRVPKIAIRLQRLVCWSRAMALTQNAKQPTAKPTGGKSRVRPRQRRA